MRNLVLLAAIFLIMATAAFRKSQRSQLPQVKYHKRTKSRFDDLRRKC